MKDNKRISITFWALSILFSVISALARTYAMTVHYDMHTGYFFSGTALPTILNITTAIFVLILLSSAIFANGCTSSFSLKPTPLSCFASVLMSIVFMLAFLFYITSIGSGNSLMGVLLTLLSPLSALYFLFDFVAAKKENEKIKDFKALLGLCPILWYLCLMLSVYFSRALPTNSPTKSYAYLALISVIFFLIYESHIIFGEKQSNIYLATGYACTLLCLSVSISHIVCAPMAEQPFILSALYDFILLATGIYSAVKTLHISKQ